MDSIGTRSIQAINDLAYELKLGCDVTMLVVAIATEYGLEPAFLRRKFKEQTACTPELYASIPLEKRTTNGSRPPRVITAQEVAEDWDRLWKVLK